MEASDDEFGVSNADLEALKMDRTLLTGQTSVQQARSIIEEASPMAAMQLVNLARFATSETVRLRASTEILSRAGVEAGEGKSDDGKEPWSDLFDKVVKEISSQAEAYANKGGSDKSHSEDE